MIGSYTNKALWVVLLMIPYLLSITSSFGQAGKNNIGDSPSLSFRSNSAALSSDATSILAAVAGKLKENASYTLLVTAYPNASERSQTLSDKRYERIKAYLTEKEGVSADRISINKKIGGGDQNLYLLSNITSSVEQSGTCVIGDLPSISFRGNSGSLVESVKLILNSLANRLKDNPFCSIVITGYPAATKASQALCSKRIVLIKDYLTEKTGISPDRIEINCEPGGGDANTVDIKSN